MEKIVLQSPDKSYLKKEIKKYSDYVASPITKNGKFYSVILLKNLPHKEEYK